MIVDDHAGTREMIRKFMTLPGVSFCECGSGEEAVQRVHDFKPHWITMDIDMPGWDGFRTTETLRREFPSARVIIVTAHNEPHFRQLSSAAGAIAMICKENLLAVRTIMAGKKEEACAADSTGGPDTPPVR